MIVTIDGPAGSGKSSLARAVSEALAFEYIQTGRYYRILAHYWLTAGKPMILFDDFPARIDFVDKRTPYQFMRPVDLAAPEISRAAAELAQYPEVVRAAHRACQSITVGNRNRNYLVEGRDTGTMMFPAAQLKYWLETPVEVRAIRCAGRFPPGVDPIRELTERDVLDASRSYSPMARPIDAKILDGNLTIADLTEKITQDFRSLNAITAST